MSELDDVHSTPINGSAVGKRTPLTLQPAAREGSTDAGCAAAGSPEEQYSMIRLVAQRP
jgi:hypothetical protein